MEKSDIDLAIEHFNKHIGNINFSSNIVNIAIICVNIIDIVISFSTLIAQKSISRYFIAKSMMPNTLIFNTQDTAHALQEN